MQDAGSGAGALSDGWKESCRTEAHVRVSDGTATSSIEKTKPLGVVSKPSVALTSGFPACDYKCLRCQLIVNFASNSEDLQTNGIGSYCSRRWSHSTMSG